MAAAEMHTCTEAGVSLIPRGCQKFSWQFCRPMGHTTAAVQPGKKKIARVTLKKINGTSRTEVTLASVSYSVSKSTRETCTKLFDHDSVPPVRALRTPLLQAAARRSRGQLRQKEAGHRVSRVRGAVHDAGHDQQPSEQLAQGHHLRDLRREGDGRQELQQPQEEVPHGLVAVSRMRQGLQKPVPPTDTQYKASEWAFCIYYLAIGEPNYQRY